MQTYVDFLCFLMHRIAQFGALEQVELRWTFDQKRWLEKLEPLPGDADDDKATNKAIDASLEQGAALMAVSHSSAPPFLCVEC